MTNRMENMSNIIDAHLYNIIENYIDEFEQLLLDYNDDIKKNVLYTVKYIVDTLLYDDYYVKFSIVFPEILEKLLLTKSTSLLYNAFDYLFNKDIIKTIIQTSYHIHKHLYLCKIMICISELLNTHIEIVINNNIYSNESIQTFTNKINERICIIYDDIQSDNIDLNEILEILRINNLENKIKDEHCMIDVDNIKHNISDFIYKDKNEIV